MKGGTRQPHPAVRSKRTGKRIAMLWPDEDHYDDRVTNQVIPIYKLFRIHALFFLTITVNIVNLLKNSFQYRKINKSIYLHITKMQHRDNLQ